MGRNCVRSRLRKVSGEAVLKPEECNGGSLFAAAGFALQTCGKPLLREPPRSAGTTDVREASAFPPANISPHQTKPTRATTELVGFVLGKAQAIDQLILDLVQHLASLEGCCGRCVPELSFVILRLSIFLFF